MRIAMTGVSGFIGARLAYELRTSHLLIPLERAVQCDVPAFDLAQPSDLRQKLVDVQADVIIHAGAMARLRECNEKPKQAMVINVHSTAVIAEWAAMRRIPMIFLSTVGVHEGNVYANTKHMAELCVQASGAEACILRLAYTYGWSPSLSRPGPQLRLEAEANAPGSQVFDDSWGFQPTSMTHLCRVLECILCRRNNLPPIVNVVVPEMTTMYDLASLSLSHNIRRSMELNGRIEKYIDMRELSVERLPICTMEFLLSDIQSVIKR